MAVIFVSKPAVFVLAGNPVLLTVCSQLVDKKFLKAHASLSMQLYQDGKRVSSSVTEFSIPTLGNNERVVFNLSSPLLAMLQQRQVEPLRGKDKRQAGGCVVFEYECWDSYVTEDHVTIESVRVKGNKTLAVAGSYSDVQRALGVEDTSLALTDGTVMTNRPDGLLHPCGCPFVLPVLRVSTDASAEPAERFVSVIDSGGREVAKASIAGKANEVEHILLSDKWVDLPAGNYSVGGIAVTLVPPDAKAVYFEFVNRLGALESFVCYTWSKEKYKFGFDRNLRHHPYTFQPSLRWVKHNTSREYVISMSTGPLNRTQAHWVVQDFFTSEQCWMFDADIERMIPVVIESESGSIYDFTKPQVIDLDFDVVRSWDGAYIKGFFSRNAF